MIRVRTKKKQPVVENVLTRARTREGNVIKEVRMNHQWKYFERFVATKFHSKRALMLGTDLKSDVISDVFVIDCKLQSNWSILKWYDDLRSYAKESNKEPILVVRKPKDRTTLAIVELDYLVHVLQQAGIVKSDDIPFLPDDML
jgi:hypothetical protein